MRRVMKGNATGGTRVSFGEFGLQSMGTAWVTSRQIEAARRSITGYTRRAGKVWICIFPDKPISKKPPEVRMGGGKGDLFAHVACVKPGRIMFELAGVPREIALEALRLASHKLPVKTKIIVKGELN